jgi:hypothetical protein
MAKATTKKNGKTKKVTLEVVTLSEISRRYGVSRQSCRSWVERHADTFPTPVFAHGVDLVTEHDGKTVTLHVNDPHGKALFYVASEVHEWWENGPLQRRQSDPNWAPMAKPVKAEAKPKKKKPAAKKPASVKKTTSKKKSVTTKKRLAALADVLNEGIAAKPKKKSSKKITPAGATAAKIARKKKAAAA